MNRRKFFSLLVGMTAAPTIIKALGTKVPPGMPLDLMHYGGQWRFVHEDLMPFEYHSIRGMGYRLYEIRTRKFEEWRNI